MADPDVPDAAALTPTVSTARWWAGVMVRVAGVVLFVLAVWMAGSRFDWSGIFSHSPMWLGLLLAAIVANCLVSAFMLLLITRTFAPSPQVGFPLMCRLLFAGGLFNYAAVFVPAGLFYRAGYLKTRHAVPLTASGKTILLMFLSSVLVCGLILLALGFAYGWAIALVVLGVWSALMPHVWAGFSPTPGAGLAWSWPVVRLLEIGCQGLRVWLSFKAVGHDLSATHALLIGAVSVLAGLASGMPSALGVREWAVGLSASVMGITQGPAGLAAALVDRACEVACFILLGGPSAAWVMSKESNPDRDKGPDLQA